MAQNINNQPAQQPRYVYAKGKSMLDPSNSMAKDVDPRKKEKK